MEPATAPEWVTKHVIPQISGKVRNVQMLNAKSAIVFSDDHALVARKGLFTGVKVFRAEFPAGLLIHGSRCPTCSAPLREPIGKTARLASAPPSPKRGGLPSATVEVPVGPNQDVIEVEGIGPAFAERLHAAGINTTDDLMTSAIERVALAAQAPRATAEKWIQMAHLMRVRDVGKQFSELLVRAGVTSIADLSRQDAAALVTRLEEYQASLDVSIQGSKLSKKRVAGWIANAKKTKTKKIPRT